MCSVNDSDNEKIFMESKPLLRERTCRKCNENEAEVVLHGKHAYCRECFLKSTTHKFRATLGKSKVVRANDAVLIAFSGSASSTALLNLVSVGLNEAVQKRLRFRPYALFIDEGALLQQTRSERLSIVKQINDHVMKYNFPAFYTTLEQCCRRGTNVEYVSLASTLQPDPESEQKLNSLFKIKSLTSKEDLLTYLRYQLLINIAKKLECSKIFVAETATKLATTLLSNVSLGRGSQSPLNIGFADERDPHIKILRPMREFMNKEVVFYNTFQNITSVFIPALGTQAPSDSSIQKLTEKFVMELETDYPSTASVVFRTGEKLSLNKKAELEDTACCMCKAPLEDVPTLSSAQQATEFSHLVSTLGPSGFTLSGNQITTPCNIRKETNEIESCCKSISSLDIKNNAPNCDCANGYTGLNLSKIKLSLCYGCRLILKDMNSIDALPIDIVKNIQTYSNLKNMKNEISEFLL